MDSSKLGAQSVLQVVYFAIQNEAAGARSCKAKKLMASVFKNLHLF